MGVHQWARQVIEQSLQGIEVQGFDQALALRALLNAAIERNRVTRSATDLAAELQFLADNLDGEREYSFMRPWRSMFARRQFTRKQIVFKWIASDRVLFRGPCAKVNQLAALRAEGPARALRAPLDGGAAGGAGD